MAAPAAASPAAAPILPVLGAGATGIGLGELGRRGLAQQGFEDFDYPSNTPELLRDPLGTLRDGLKGLAESYGDAFGLQDLAGTPPPVPLSDPADAPPFTGGQSPGVLYRVSYSRWINDPPILGSSDVKNGLGPISIRVTDASGTQHAIFGGESLISGIGSFRPDIPGHGYRIDSIQRVDGQPDTGGDPAPNPTQKAGTPSRAKPSAFVPSPLSAPQTAPRTAPKPTAPPFSPFEMPSPGTLSPPTAPGKLSPPKGIPTTPAPAPPQAAPPAPGSADPDSSGKLKPKPKPKPKADPETDPDDEDPSKKDICKSPCIVEILRLLKKIYGVVGADEFPGTMPLLSGKGSVTVKNIPELIRWVIQSYDSVNGQFPLNVEVFGANGRKSTVKLENLAHSIDEMFGLMLTIAEDADAAVNIAARNVVESIQGKIAAKQAGEIATANAKFLGYNIQAKQRQVKISVTPSAAGSDNKLQNQEMADFLSPSTQDYIGTEYQDDKQVLPILERTLESGEIARAALFRPVKASDGNKDIGLTGEFIRNTRKSDEILNKAWKQFLDQLAKEGYEVDGNNTKSK